ncbi:MAG: type I-F CRISPR-associated endoribonuclease Cas6/Csy4 [Methylococcaceae bacterium]
MMKYYQELELKPQDEISLHFLWSKIFQQIHLGLVEMKDDQGHVSIGVAFPEYVMGEKFRVLGGKCRLFAVDEATLVKFDAVKWLSRLSDYVHCTSIRPVPDKLKGYARYQRLQPKTSPERLARRYAKRKGVDFADAFNSTIQLNNAIGTSASYVQTFRYCDMPIPMVTTPFIRLQSLSGGQTFCLWIKKTVQTEVSGGTFSTYGLSAESTVPEF